MGHTLMPILLLFSHGTNKNCLNGMIILKSCTYDKISKKTNGMDCFAHAGWPFFPTFESQVPHLSFYEYLEIL
jgi:hypothetical protein